jgi:HSP20 family molecular chaperone IbpA
MQDPPPGRKRKSGYRGETRQKQKKNVGENDDSEVSYGSFSLTKAVPAAAQQKAAKAKYGDGAVPVSLRKSRAA